MSVEKNDSGYQKFFIGLGVIIILLLLVLIVLLSPLKELIFPEQSKPTIELMVIEPLRLDPATGKYRVVVEAIVSGKPEPEVRFNRNDGLGAVEPNQALLLLEENENFILTAVASNVAGQATAALELFGGLGDGDGTVESSDPDDTTDIGTDPEYGSIRGNLSYPSEFIPPLRVVAFNLDDGYAYYIDTDLNQTTYQIDNLPPGTYHVVAYGEFDWGGGYTQFVLDGLMAGFDDHSLLPVTVVAGEVTEGIDPADWYAPEDAFPLRP